MVRLPSSEKHPKNHLHDLYILKIEQKLQVYFYMMLPPMMKTPLI